MVARITDVAERAGVSTATVSRVLNGKPVTPARAEAVRRAVEELSYVPDRRARSLRRGTGGAGAGADTAVADSDVVTLVLPDIENPFFTSLARGVEDVAQSSGLSVVLCNTDDLPAKEARYLSIADRENVTGVLIASAGSAPGLGPLLRAGRAVVAVDRAVEADVDHVLLDNVGLARRATLALAERGCTRIACVSGPDTVSSARDRTQGWRDGLRQAGIAVDEELLVVANFRVDGGYAAASALLAENAADGIVATNNLVGVGVLRALAEVPEPSRPLVVVVGRLPFMTGTAPGVLVVPTDAREMGAVAARMLVDRVEGYDGPARHVVMAPSDVIADPEDVLAAAGAGWT